MGYKGEGSWCHVALQGSDHGTGGGGHGIPSSEEPSCGLDLGFSKGILVLGVQRWWDCKEIAWLWGVVRARRLKGHCMRQGTPIPLPRTGSNFFKQCLGHFKQLFLLESPGLPLRQPLQAPRRAGAELGQDALLPQFAAGGQKGSPSNCLFFQEAAGSGRRALPAQAALGPGVLFPCQPSCLRNYCVLQGNKGFSQHRLSWC